MLADMATEHLPLDVAIVEQVRELVGTEHVTSFIEEAVRAALAERGGDPGAATGEQPPRA